MNNPKSLIGIIAVGVVILMAIVLHAPAWVVIAVVIVAAGLYFLFAKANTDQTHTPPAPPGINSNAPKAPPTKDLYAETKADRERLDELYYNLNNHFYEIARLADMIEARKKNGESAEMPTEKRQRIFADFSSEWSDYKAIQSKYQQEGAFPGSASYQPLPDPDLEQQRVEWIDEILYAHPKAAQYDALAKRYLQQKGESI